MMVVAEHKNGPLDCPQTWFFGVAGVVAASELQVRFVNEAVVDRGFDATRSNWEDACSTGACARVICLALVRLMTRSIRARAGRRFPIMGRPLRRAPQSPRPGAARARTPSSLGATMHDGHRRRSATKSNSVSRAGRNESSDRTACRGVSHYGGRRGQFHRRRVQPQGAADRGFARRDRPQPRMPGVPARAAAGAD